VLGATALTLAVLLAQSPADEVTSLERQRADAIRDGQNGGRFYTGGFRGISGLGQYETRDQAIAADASRPRGREISVEVHGDTAIATGIETIGGTGDRDRVVRIWTRANAVPGGPPPSWTVVAAQTTWIGARAGAPPPSGPLPNSVDAFTPRTDVEAALWKSQDALMRSFSQADPASYRLYSTDHSLRLTTAGDAIARESWLDTIARRAKGPLAVVDEVHIAAYGDVGIVTLRGHEANPTRQSWIYLKQDGVWKLHLRYTTLIR
jgi:ketosteroid isomerase-like protein